MYFVQIRRTRRVLYWFIAVIGLVLGATSLFGNVLVHGSIHHIVDYRQSSSSSPVRVDLVLLKEFPQDVAWPAFPWGRLTTDQLTADHPLLPHRRPSHLTIIRYPGRDFTFKERTAAGIFVEKDHIPRQQIIVYPNGYHRILLETMTVTAPNGLPVQWHDEFEFDGLDVFGQPASLFWLLVGASVLCALFGVVAGIGLGEDVADHLAIVRTRPVGMTTFVLSAIGLDITQLTIGVGLVALLLYASPINGYIIAYGFDVWSNPTKTDTVVRTLAVALVWCLTLACYGITLALTTARKRVTALVALSAVAVIELIVSSSIGYGLPHALAWLKPGLDALNPIGHYSIVYANIFFAKGSPTDSLDSTIHNLLSLLGLAVVGMLTATLRWRAARI